MSRIAKRLEKERVVHANDLLEEAGLLDACPYRYVFVKGTYKQWAELFSAVELLEGRGWEIVDWTIDATNEAGAVARRVP
ncbi:hypothetical protein [Actinomadura rubrisoli]|uniref:Uncharacterized protein n=1 Tax=Actinomadura rubrisoli TaxID=2530368 RepID=A0A4R5CA18_9ACTN|nr:hypothetical protein [Actinomadura rubrisoli]TDD96728.1 hypothetical protein E1298_02890 [Actinomadura rubrisoli]